MHYSSLLSILYICHATSGVLGGTLGRTLGLRSLDQSPYAGQRHHRSTQAPSHDTIAPKVMIISTFAPEANVWYDTTLNLFANNITVTGLSPLWPDVHCSADGDVCQVTSGLGIANAASSMQALWMSPLFDLRATYILIAAIAGINPYEATTGSVTFADYVVNLDLQNSFSQDELPTNDSSIFFPLGSEQPDSSNPDAYPTDWFGWEAFELNKKLISSIVNIVSNVPLNDSAEAAAYRAKYDFAPANEAPGVVVCASGASNLYWTGANTGFAFSNYTRLITNGSATYCATNTEDSGLHEGLIRGAIAGRLDYSRVINMRTASDFDRAPRNVNEVYHLFDAPQGGYDPSLINIRLAGMAIVDAILEDWTMTYEAGIEPDNYIGDGFGSLKGQEAKRDIG
ncbi:hypothetical protein LTR10_018018 [Elasticomyces elasticus]|uniref:Purine nucleoside permease n=1 Tax=Exophiala sideris TaxID=1016849 RepID=A0ABR0JAQ5_9EURO|nr:hypothetical protein LTR10_018018 [Elasticomyces elasticus]KAK5026115.1 hypothetical protein LTS07_007640 [Exophiala sideris]KAK5032369.1 hypothetical protein LTR13_007192 [Exophiala sideris]KAK5059525.1 hypothetical protein LTR69_006114 [Exophiala sideris]KAK5186687.1 hypothetical protein LTR44_000693 [Eurotiomycetes sp. CCFEE 6388]